MHWESLLSRDSYHLKSDAGARRRERQCGRGYDEMWHRRGAPAGAASQARLGWAGLGWASYFVSSVHAARVTAITS